MRFRDYWRGDHRPSCPMDRWCRPHQLARSGIRIILGVVRNHVRAASISRAVGPPHIFMNRQGWMIDDLAVAGHVPKKIHIDIAHMLKHDDTSG